MQGIEVSHYIEVVNMWLELINKIKYEIEKAHHDIPVMVGFYNPHNAGIDERGLVMLGRGEATVIDAKVHNMLKQEFYIECWIRADPNVLEDAYRRIAELEQTIEDVLIDFREQCGALNEDICVLSDSNYQIVDIRCTNKTDDHDSMRPFTGTQYRFEATLYDLNNDTKGGIY